VSDRSILYRGLGAIGLILVSVILILPSFLDPVPSWLSFVEENKVGLGLDLQGGTHLILSVDVDEAVRSYVDVNAEQLRRDLRDEDVRSPRVRRTGDIVATVSVPEEFAGTLQQVLEERFPYFESQDSRVEDGRAIRDLALIEAEIQRIHQSAVEQSLETIRNRIDQLGVAEPVIQRQGKERVLVQLPGLDDPERALDIIGKTAQLEFKAVAEDQTPLARGLSDPSAIPEGMEILYQRSRDPISGQMLRPEPLLIEKKVLMTGDALAHAEVRIGSQFNYPIVALEFTSDGAVQFDAVAAKMVGRRLAVILDDTVYSAPNIRQSSYGGSAVIEGAFGDDEAHDLALVLRAGALPAPVQVLEKRAVGATLGKDSIRAGALAMSVGFAIVVVFMAIYYKGAGVIADIALILNLCLILGSMALLQATFTLPGIAALVLTVGMAVDGSVIIFERIREELRLGKSPRAAVDGGFGKALMTILDANITTFIAAVVLFQFGTGPIKGFAVMLTIGIIWSVVTVVFVSRVMFDFLVTSRKVSALSI